MGFLFKKLDSSSFADIFKELHYITSNKMALKIQEEIFAKLQLNLLFNVLTVPCEYTKPTLRI